MMEWGSPMGEIRAWDCISMRERAEELGGELAVELRQPGPGTRLSVTLPYSANGAALHDHA